MQISVNFDERSYKQMSYLQAWHGHWMEHLHGDLAKDLAEAAKKYYKPFMKSKRGSGLSTGETSNSVRYEIDRSPSGFTVNYFGLLSALYMDTGNFEPSQTLHAPLGNVKKAFPVDMRFGLNIYSPTIHGMGHRTSGVPTHASEKTVDYLEKDTATDIGLKSMRSWLDSVVIGA